MFDFLGPLNLWGGGFTGALLPFLFVLTIVVFFHELGHFMVARWCGVRVLVFSVGFGPELFGFTDRHGTRWKVSAIPLGGYVKFFGDDNAASVPDQEALARMSAAERRVSFFDQPVRNRAAIVAAGPIANFILAIVIFAAIFMLVGKSDTTARIDEVLPGSVAERAGFRAGDTVVTINGSAIENFSDMQRTVSTNAGEELRFGIERNGTQIEITARPELREEKDAFGNVHKLGILGVRRSLAPGEAKFKKVDPLTAVSMGVGETWFVAKQTLTYLGRIVVGRESAEQLGGPLRIAQVSGQVATISLSAVFHLAAVLSVSIGLLNLFPIPMLDGGHLLFYLVEALRGRPLSDYAQEMGFRVGVFLILALMIFATRNDIMHFLRTVGS